MALIGKGFINDKFGLGLSFGDVEYHAAVDDTGNGDQYGRNVLMTKTNPGDPNFTVIGYGQRYVATRKITIGLGVTLLGNANGGGIGQFHLGAPGTTLGSGGDGGQGAVGAGAGTAGTSSANARGGSGGAGGGVTGHLGGSAGLASVSNFKGMYRNVELLYNGWTMVGGTVRQLDGGMGGGGGASGAGGTGGNDGGGGAGVIILAAPTIEVAGTIDMRGSIGIAGGGCGPSGGGGGGGGGMLILICGELILTGSILLNGGAGGAPGGGGGAVGGAGGSGGRMWIWNGDPETFTETVGSTGAHG